MTVRYKLGSFLTNNPKSPIFLHFLHFLHYFDISKGKQRATITCINGFKFLKMIITMSFCEIPAVIWHFIRAMKIIQITPDFCLQWITKEWQSDLVIRNFSCEQVLNIQKYQKSKSVWTLQGQYYVPGIVSRLESLPALLAAKHWTSCPKSLLRSKCNSTTRSLMTSSLGFINRSEKSFKVKWY